MKMLTIPVGGSLFLFDRKILRYFRKDGHNWRKKKDGKTVREAHEKLKVSQHMISCCRNPPFLIGASVCLRQSVVVYEAIRIVWII